MDKLKNFSERFTGKEKTWVNEVMWYDTEEHNVFIHLAPANVSPHVKRNRDLLSHALTQTALDMNERPQLQGKEFLIAASSIVKRNPYIFQRLGFTVFNGATDEENIEAMEKLGVRGIRKGITRPDEAMAAISTTDLVARYGFKNENPGTNVSGRTKE